MLFAMGGLRLWLKKHAVFREIHDGVGGVQQELSMEMNRNITKKLAHLLTQQLTIHWEEGVEIKYAANKNQNKSTQKDPKTEMVCNDATRNEHVLDQKTNIKSGEE